MKPQEIMIGDVIQISPVDSMARSANVCMSEPPAVE
jgi:hypothetical protein